MITIEGTATVNSRNNDGWFIVEETSTCLDQGRNPNCVSSNADSPSPYSTSDVTGVAQASISTWIIVEDHRGAIATSLGATTHRFHGETGVETFQDEDCTGTVTISMRGHPVQWSNELESEYYPHDAQEDEAHFYAECSNKGFCNRKSGECECLPGYEGVGCERMACANDCSGHGTCESITDLVNPNDEYALWDGTNVPKTYGCKCDARWSGPDCSARVCPFGDDPLTTGQIDEVQSVELSSASGHTTSGYFSLYFTDEFGEVWRTSSINARAYVESADTADCVFSSIERSVTCSSGLSVFDDEDFITISGTTAGTMQYTDSANDGEFRVFDPMTTNSRTESVSDTKIVFAEGVSFVDYDEDSDSTFDSFEENPSDNKVLFQRSNGLKTALLGIPNDVVQDVSVSVADVDSDNHAGTGITYLVTFTSNPGDLPEMICDNSAISGDVNSFSTAAFPVKISEDANTAFTFTAPDTITMTTSTADKAFLDTGAAGSYSAKTAFRDSDHILVTGTEQNDGIYEIQHHPNAVTSTTIKVRQAVRTEGDNSVAEAVIYKQQCQVRSEIKRVGFYDATTYTGAGSADGTTDADCKDLAVAVTGVGANAASYNKYAITAGSGCDLSKFDVGEQLTIECASGACNNDGKIVTVTNNDPEGNSLTVLAGASDPSATIHGAGRTDKVGDGTDTLVADASPTQMFVTRYGHGTKEQASCSGRGLCDGKSGVCACFKGYTGDDCSAQNALAM